jgi:Ca2+-transporting ATPase
VKTQELIDRQPIVGSLAGVTAADAAARIVTDGYNELPSTKPRSTWAIAFNVAREPMFMLLMACGAIYLLLGDTQEALMLLGFVSIVIGITLFQERKTERALEALRDLSSPRAMVVRDGEPIRIPGRDVVHGDLIMLTEGDRVPADAVVRSCSVLAIDESLLTGESVPVRKRAWRVHEPQQDRPGGDDLPFIFSGSLVVQGSGTATVHATGPRTEIGRIGKALTRMQQEPTRIQRETGVAVKRLAWVGLALAALVAIWYGVARADWLNGLLVGITLAMAILPEELPVILTIFLGLGAWRISKKRVLIRQIPAVESLGSATVLCVDKTGTLTQNRMTLAMVSVGGQSFDVSVPDPSGLPERFHKLLEFSVLASQRDPFDPMEKAIREAGHTLLAGTDHWHENWILVEEYPLSPELLAMSRVWQSPEGDRYVIAAKGAPEAIVDLCHLGPQAAEAVSREINVLAEQGLRVLGVAGSNFTRTILPGIQHDFEFHLLGFIGLLDPVRPAVPAAITQSREAGIRVVMMTGDHPTTAKTIAQQIGLVSDDGIITGPDLDAMSDAELQRQVGRINVFCRVVPEQKLRLVNALKISGEIVAMTGDGVNDAPALKAAHIGIAMGGRGTDVAREAAAVVLLDDDFSSIVEAVKLGRRIFDNLKKAIAFVIAAHLPIVGLSLVPVMLGWPLILLPVHILFLQLIIDPACSIVFEAESEENDIMRRPPRAPGAPLFDRSTITLGLLQGLCLFLIVLMIFSISLYRGDGAEHARTLTFTALILASLGLIVTNRSWSRSMADMFHVPNQALWWVIGSALALLILVLTIPVLREVFRFTALDPIDLAVCMIAGIIGLVAFELTKRFGGGTAKDVPIP